MNERILRLFLILFLGASVSIANAMDGNSVQPQMYENGAEEGDNGNEEAAIDNESVEVVEDEAARELKTKQDVRNIVDRLLKINKQVEVRSDDPKVKRLMKEQNIGKQIDQLRADIKDLEKTLNSHYTEIKKTSDKHKNENDAVATDKQDTDSAKQGASTGKRRVKSWKSSRRSKTTRVQGKRSNIHTVKNVATVPNTNSYLQRLNQRANVPAKYSSKRVTKTYNYKVKCYGKGGSCASAKASTATAKAPSEAASQMSKSHTVKKVNYFNPNCGTRSCR
ncbi:MAG: hypothetical protein K6C34_03695 [Alphaproteobacteria bacterium]|nr:hypothetical protein [Alphaproteobacteria bacterium]